MLPIPKMVTRIGHPTFAREHPSGIPGALIVGRYGQKDRGNGMDRVPPDT